MVILYRRTERYGDAERVRWKNKRRKLTRADRIYLESFGAQTGHEPNAEDA
jgi:hypothetical protein